MKNKIIAGIFMLVFTVILFNSCSNNTGGNMPSRQSNGITFFKDTITGLCFGKVSSMSYSGYGIESITCVPCDSLKKLGL